LINVLEKYAEIGRYCGDMNSIFAASVATHPPVNLFLGRNVTKVPAAVSANSYQKERSAEKMGEMNANYLNIAPEILKT